MIHRFVTAALLLLLVPLTAAADRDAATVTTPHATVSLLSEQARAVPGATLWLGLHFELEPHWHVYWRNPGASGSPPVIRWRLPEGWQAGEIHWPVPARIRVGPLVNYGYEDEVTFLVPVQVPTDAAVDDVVGLIAEAEWLVCREECIPESGRFSLALDGAGTHSTPATEARFAKARARWPATERPNGSYRIDGARTLIRIPGSKPFPSLAEHSVTDVWFAGDAWGPVDPSGEQRWAFGADGLSIEVPTGDLPASGDAPLDGLLVVETATDGPTRRGFELQLGPEPLPGSKTPLGLAAALLFALLGGLILNAMPCVLPVLGIKVLGFVKEAGENRARLAGHGLVYTAGVLISLILLAAALLLLRAGGESLGWGFQLQSPVLVAGLAGLMLLVGLNLSGVFSIGTSLMGAGQSLTAGRGFLNTFATGVLAVVVASPCTAPFMGAALGFAVTRPPGESLAVFAALGVGFALPVLLLSLLPAWVRLVPSPGPWMKGFQQALAFPMYATSAWLLWVLSQQTGAVAYGAALAGLVLIAFGAWLYGRWSSRVGRLGVVGIGVAVLAALALGPLSGGAPATGIRTAQEDLAWSSRRVDELLDTGRPVFVNFTAAWCITCKVNEQVALATDDTRRLFADHSVAYLVADWTRRDAVIGRELERYGRSGVPLYLLYSPAAEQPQVLPQLLTEGLIAEAVNQL